MSPEQATGEVADARADVWAFGVVLYEMLCGMAPFRGDTVTATLGEVLRSEPDWSRLPPETPAGIRRLLKRCLRKERAQRLHDIVDARLEIDEVGDEPDVSIGHSDRANVPLPRRLIWALASALGLVTVVAALQTAQLWRQPPPPLAPEIRFEITAEATSPTDVLESAGALSGWADDRVSAGRRGRSPSVGEVFGCTHTSPAERHGERVAAVLVSSTANPWASSPRAG